MRIEKHNFRWETNDSHEIFWKFHDNLLEKAKDQVEKILKQCPVPDGSKVLDVGCGLGYHVLEFGRRGFDVVGIDIADYSVERAKENCKDINNATILKMCGIDIPWRNEFDLVIALGHTLGFMSNEELKIHMKKTIGALKEGGRFFFYIPYTLEEGLSRVPSNKWRVVDGKYVLEDIQIDQNNIKKEFCVIIDPINDRIDEYYEEQRYYSWKEILELFRECGLAEVTTLKDFEGNIATEAKDAKNYYGIKNKKLV